MEWFVYWKAFSKQFLLSLGLTENNIKLYDHPQEKLSFYSNATTDILYRFPWGFDELWGIASRTDYDLKSHMKHSNESLEYLDPETNEKYIPYVIEPSLGVERLFLSILNETLEEQVLEGGETRTLLKIHPALAPYKVAILPLLKKYHTEKANEIYAALLRDFTVTYDESGNIGKRYRRQDAIGTPYCITIDEETLNNNTVTIRERDSMAQIKLPVSELKAFFQSKL